jgi:hypothetical protein
LQKKILITEISGSVKETIKDVKEKGKKIIKEESGKINN